MPEEKKPRHPETNFLPPLDMVLSFFKKKNRPSAVNNTPPESEEVQGHAVKLIINHITHDEQPTSRPEDERLADYKTKGQRD